MEVSGFAQSRSSLAINVALKCGSIARGAPLVSLAFDGPNSTVDRYIDDRPLAEKLDADLNSRNA
jgi:hypothetical protein